MSRTYVYTFTDSENRLFKGKMRCHFVNDDEHGRAMVQATLAIHGFTLVKSNPQTSNPYQLIHSPLYAGFFASALTIVSSDFFCCPEIFSCTSSLCGGRIKVSAH